MGGFFREARALVLARDHGGALLRGAAWSFGLRVSGVGLGMVAAILLARMLAAEGYGTYAYAVSWLALLVAPAALGLDHALVRFLPGYRAKAIPGAPKALLRYALTRGLLMSVLVALGALILITVIPGLSPDFRSTLAITIAILPIAVLSQLRQAALRGLDRPRDASIPEHVVYPILLIVLVAMSYRVVEGPLSPSEAAFANLTAWALAAIVGLLFLVRAVPSLGAPGAALEPASDRPAWASMVAPIVLTAVAHHAISRGDVLALGMLAPPRDVGLYVVAGRGAELVMFVSEAITFAGASLFAGLFATDDRERLQRFVRLATRLILGGTLPLYLGLLVFAPWLLGLFGPEFVEATLALRIMCTAFFLSSLGGFLIPMLYSTGHQRDVTLVVGSVACLNVALAFVLVPLFGYVGAAIGSGISLVAMNGILVTVVYRRTGIISLPFGSTRRPRPSASSG